MRSTGVYEMIPKSHSVFDYKCSIDMGEISAEKFFKKNKSNNKSNQNY